MSAGTTTRPTAAGLLSRIDVVSDAICPWCWIGKRHLEGALARLAGEGERFEVHWRPFQLNPDMPREGVERAAYRAAKFGTAERSRELDAQVAAAGATAGLEFRFDRQGRTPNTVDAHCLVRRAGAVGGTAVQDAVVEALFRAYFQEGRDIGNAAVLAEIASGAGLADAAAVLASGEGEAEVREEDAGFRRLGISGVPSFALAGHVLFSGAVPAERMADVFRRALAILRERGAQ
jgi:predicted DsbA family dithiol-disulfide isomerase